MEMMSMRYSALVVLLGAAVGAAETSMPAQTQTAPPQAPAAPVTPRAARPFPEGFKVAVINPDRIVAESALGKASTARMTAFRAQRVAELNTKSQELESGRQKLAMGSLLSDDARATVQKRIDRLQVELQRTQQDAEAAIQELQQQLNVEFDRSLTPVVEQVALERGIYLLLRVDTGTLAWADPALDLTSDIVKRLDATTAQAIAKPPKGPQGPQPRP
jgi:Skp family chaperone for outer membrane proteins